MTEFEKMVSGQLFNGSDGSVNKVREQATGLLQELNHNTSDAQRVDLFRRLLKRFGEASMIRSPFLCEFGQIISIGDSTFINMNVTMLDGADITIGNHVLIGPNTQFYTAGHPLDYRSRRGWETTCLPIIVEDDVWIGGVRIYSYDWTLR